MNAPLSFLNTIYCPRLRYLYAYWQERRGDCEMPLRSDINPTDLAKVLATIFLADVFRGDSLRFRIRLAGTHIEAAFGRPLAGCYIDELELDAGKSHLLAYRRTAEERQPVVSRHLFVLGGSFSRFSYERLWLPLGVQDERTVEMILGGICFDAPLQTPSAFGARDVLHPIDR